MAKTYERPYIVEATFDLPRTPLLAAIPDPTFILGKSRGEGAEKGQSDPVRAQDGFERYNGGAIAIPGKYPKQILWQLYRGTGIMNRSTFSNMRGLNTELPPETPTSWLLFPVIPHGIGGGGGGLTRYEAILPEAGLIIPLRFELQESHVDYDEFESALREAAGQGQLCLGLAKNSAGYGELRCLSCERVT